MKTILSWMGMFGILALPLSAQDMGVEAVDDEKPCDLKTIEKTKYCESCDAIDPKCDDKGECKGCGGGVTEVDVCVKSYCKCSACKNPCEGDKPCCKDATCETVTIKARIVFLCEGCGMSGDKEGDCAGDECKKAGKKVKKTCDNSGAWPHGGEPPKNKKK